MSRPPPQSVLSSSSQRRPFRNLPPLSILVSLSSVLLVAQLLPVATTLSFSPTAHRQSPLALASVTTCTGNVFGGGGRLHWHQHRRRGRRRRWLQPAEAEANSLLAGLRAGASSDDDDEEEEADDDDLTRPPYEIEPLPLRIGHGFDIHRMAPLEEAGQPIVIAGVEIPHDDQKWVDVEGKYVQPPGSTYSTQLGVVAHSDGDVVYHSIVDAIFGALTLPDIGQVFADTDPRWRGCDSSKFMEYAYDVMDRYGYRVGNVDVTLILERPKVATFKPGMKENIVSLLGTTPGRVNIKARTHERVDSVGELRSLSCHVVLTLVRADD